MPKPCENCPWRKDAPLGVWTADRWQNLYQTCQDDGMALMACHKSRENAERTCAGFVIVLGYDSIGVRLATMRGTIDPKEHTAKGLELYESFDAVLAANGVQIPKRNRNPFER